MCPIKKTPCIALKKSSKSNNTPSKSASKPKFVSDLSPLLDWCCRAQEVDGPAHASSVAPPAPGLGIPHPLWLPTLAKCWRADISLADPILKKFWGYALRLRRELGAPLALRWRVRISPRECWVWIIWTGIHETIQSNEERSHIHW